MAGGQNHGTGMGATRGTAHPGWVQRQSVREGEQKQCGTGRFPQKEVWRLVGGHTTISDLARYEPFPATPLPTLQLGGESPRSRPPPRQSQERVDGDCKEQ